MPSHFSARTDAALPEGERDPLNRALRDLSHQVGSAMPRNTTPMPISVFKAQYGAVLKQADHDFAHQVQAEVITICEHVQRGLGSGSYVPGRLNPLRVNAVFHFPELLRAAYRAEPAGG